MKTTVGIAIALFLVGIIWLLQSKQRVLSSLPAAVVATSAAPGHPADADRTIIDPSLFPSSTTTLEIAPILGSAADVPLPPTDPLVVGGPPVLPPVKPLQSQLEELADPLKFIEDRTMGGIGVLLFYLDGKPRVGGVMAGSPAEAAGVQPGDTIHSIDGHATSGLPSKDITSRIQGVVGTKVVLEFRKSDNSVVSYTLERIARREIQSAPIKVR